MTCLGVDKGAAAGREHLGRSLKQALDDATLPVPEGRFTMTGKNFGNGAPGCAFDFMICIDEIEAESGRKATSNRRLSSTHQADENDNS